MIVILIVIVSIKEGKALGLACYGADIYIKKWPGRGGERERD